ncbi:HNH endonuclease [Clostridium perfringens]|nr:HNH endonuclease [Clostridium perfringens]
MCERKYTSEERNYISTVKQKSNTCCYCGKKLTFEERTVDHIQPINRGGETVLENLVVCCEGCNTEKGDMTLQEYIEYKNRKQDFTKDIDMRIQQEKENENYYIEVLDEIMKNADLISYLSNIVKTYNKKINTIAKLKKITKYKLEGLKKEKQLMEELFDLEIIKNKRGNLDSKDIEFDFNYKLKLDKDKLIRDPIIKSIIINSTINNVNVNSRFINNSYVFNGKINNGEID